MGLFSTTRIVNEGDTIINLPDTIKIHEHKAPTDESIRLMEEMHHKAIQNIIAKVEVKDNIVDGKCFLIQQPTLLDDMKLVFKFKINGHEFTVEKEVNSMDFMNGDSLKEIREIESLMIDKSKTILLWYALRMFSAVAYQQITGQPVPIEYLKH